MLERQELLYRSSHSGLTRMIPKQYNLICFTSDLPWSNMWKRTQMMMEYLSRTEKIDRVIFVNPEVWLANLVTNNREQMASSHHRQYRFRWQAVIPRKVSSKVFAVTPLYFLPFSGRSKRLRRLQTGIQYLILNWLMQSKEFILFINDYDYNIEHRRLIQRFYDQANLVVYDWSDDFVEFSKEENERHKIKITCEDYIKKVHVVFAVNEGLTNRAKMINPNSYTLINATDFDHMSKAIYANWEMPRALKALSKPLIGYIGWITATRMDSEILAQLATLHPDWTIVLMGPVRQWFVETFQAIKNIVFLPPVDYLDLPRYLKFFDVCLLPHKINDHTKGNNPIKTYDYLAAGKPVVSTAVAGVESLMDVIYVADDRQNFCKLVEKAIQEDGPELQEKRLQRAKENSWSVRVQEIWRILEKYIENW